MINERKTLGSKFIENLAADIRISFPNVKGYSVRNLKYMAKFAETYPDEAFVLPPFAVPTVVPGRTFLEKVFLLHEEFNRPGGCTHIERITRHMYDVVKMMDKPFAVEAMNNRELYNDIVSHRKQFTAWSGLDYDLHRPQTHFLLYLNILQFLL